ncbi:MAG: 1-acyl-sn-glycerol-3-phosphate acyltransferase [Pseudomonadales bacterium]|nr:1-acyl-sn-glycerol-3-phosphate acyltransferase [Pseudomonadales bacterium]
MTSTDAATKTGAALLPALSLQKKIWYAARSAIFYLGYWLWTLWFGVTTPLFVKWLGYRACVRYINFWNYGVIVWLRFVCGVRYRIEGLEHVPARPYVVVAKHQSQWETFFLQLPFAPVCTILKQELLRIPLFGWGLATVKPIAIDRSARRESLKQIIDDGCARLAEGICVLIFPEGTRTEIGKAGRYARGGADLAIKAHVPLLPVAHNAGECWPGKKFLKYPGVITVVIGAPLQEAGIDSKTLMTRAEHWIENEVQRISQYR